MLAGHRTIYRGYIALKIKRFSPGRNFTLQGLQLTREPGVADLCYRVYKKI